MNSMQKTLAVVFDGGVSRSLVRGRLVSGLLVLGALGVILAAVVLSMLENVARKWSERIDEALGWQPFGFGLLFGVVVPAALLFGILVLLYRYLPRRRPGWRAALLGGGAAAIGLQGLQIGLGWYLAGPADFTQIYGSAAAIFVFLFSVYLSATVFVICAILTGVLEDALGGESVAGVPAKLPLAEFAFPGPLREQARRRDPQRREDDDDGPPRGVPPRGPSRSRSPALDRSSIDSDGRPVAVIETLEVELRRFADVGLQFAIDEGEGFETVEAWREAHVALLHLAGDGRGARRPTGRDRRRHDRRLRDVSRRRDRRLALAPHEPAQVHNARLTGKVTIQTMAPRNAVQPTARATSRDPLVRKRVLMPAKNSAIANSTTQRV